MNLIDIYIAEVGKHLPAKHKNDLLDEIHSALQDMLKIAASSLEGRSMMI